MSKPRKPYFPRLVKRHQPADGRRGQPSLWSVGPKEAWRLIKAYVGLEGRSKREPITDRAGLAHFLDTRASYMAQSSLYGYLRTRAGQRYPELFDDDPFVVSINIAKWHIWLACLSDIAVFAGGRLAHAAPREVERVGELMRSVVEEILDKAGTPVEADEEYPAHAARVRDRIARTDWLAVGEQEAAFTESPGALVRWAPIIDELKQLDEDIVRNSVRFRWQEVRRDFCADLDPHAVLGIATEPPAAEPPATS
jgi:hypothetical protein